MWKTRLICVGALLICTHALLNTFFPSAGFAISYLSWSFWSLLAAVACLWRSHRCAPGVRSHWRLAAASLSLIFLAGAIEAPAEIFFKTVPSVASIGDFLFFSAFVPILLAITLPDEGAYVRFSFLLDGLQAAACSYLAYTVLMGAFPFTGSPAQPMAYAPLEYVYDAEYVVIAGLAALRFLFGTRNPAGRSYFRFILLYTALYGLTSGIYNHFLGKYSLTNGLDALNDIPSAALALAALLAPAAANIPERAMRRMLVRVIDNARPVFLSLALIGLSAAVAVRHFAAAFAFVFGAFILSGLRASILQSRVERGQAALERSNRRLAEMALLDSLTGIANRRSFDERLAQEWERMRRARLALSLLLIDVDHFKRVNDSYGHQAGDEYLRHLAHILSAACDRPADLIARYGGEEFAVLLPETDSFGAGAVAGRIRAILQEDTGTAAGAFGPVTVSIGAATWDADQDSSPDQLISAADRALYTAKQNGRNRVEVGNLNALTVE